MIPVKDPKWVRENGNQVKSSQVPTPCHTNTRRPLWCGRPYGGCGSLRVAHTLVVSKLSADPTIFAKLR